MPEEWVYQTVCDFRFSLPQQRIDLHRLGLPYLHARVPMDSPALSLNSCVSEPRYWAAR
jgi:hypothetical protein